jgi:hypothetical protein
MADLQDLGTIASDEAFQNRCMMALEQYCANTVTTEGDQIVDHTQREAYALEVMNQQNQVSRLAVAEAILANLTIAAEANASTLPGDTASIPDGDIEFAITQVFNDLAGVST